MAGVLARLTGESQLRWIGPEKGAIHLATAAIVNAVWDLWAKSEAQAGLEAGRRHDAGAVSSPASTSATSATRSRPTRRSRSCARSADARRARGRDAPRRLPRVHHFGGLDGLSGREGARALPRGARRRMDSLQDQSRPRRGAERPPLRAHARGHRRRCALMVDANQAWDVGEAIEHVRALAQYNPLGSKSRPAPTTSSATPPIRRAVEPVGVATGEHCPNRVHLQTAHAGGGHRLLPVRQLPPRRPQRGARGAAARREIRRAGLPACGRHRPLRVRPARFADRLHLRQRQPRRTARSSSPTTCTSTSSIPVRVRDGRYLAPTAPGFSIEMLPASLDEFEFPSGAAWR